MSNKNYYKQKSAAFRLIDNGYNNGESFEEIAYKVGSLYGFGAKIVQDRIDLIEKIQEQRKKAAEILKKSKK